MDKLKILIHSCCYFILLLSCGQQQTSPETENKGVQLYILGTAQDAGAPQIGCNKSCCSNRWDDPSKHEKVVSLGVVDPTQRTSYLFEATPDIGDQMKILQQKAGNSNAPPDGIFLTHAHIGHYSGLMYLGKEAASSKAITVYTMPRMQDFLEENGPWDQLIHNGNINLSEIREDEEIKLSDALSVQPLNVPHRDEYSETVGYLIKGRARTALFIPDIDKWSRWEQDISAWIKKVDLAFLDATFYDGSELPSRSMEEIPHPFVVESLERFSELKDEDRKKIYFIHFNHTNPLLSAGSKASRELLELGFNISREGMQFRL
ncbi:MBL fold metallo-hydrolase [Zeaxanthinibacter sp. PT1]|uniref:MBL fold metallo-hydrolase n=1 Tax=Zeaxanthinibacter TaxID=561554 RepID=UPI00234AE95D|nr:MBL fold metallo-hydrolase [Zeaxanthinibacter sp. PT1]MDC6350660.1 MBL fold metallo-hydrolase [Zeaxanthinibacter sp. PT1]